MWSLKASSSPATSEKLSRRQAASFLGELNHDVADYTKQTNGFKTERSKRDSRNLFKRISKLAGNFGSPLESAWHSRSPISVRVARSWTSETHRHKPAKESAPSSGTPQPQTH